MCGIAFKIGSLILFWIVLDHLQHQCWSNTIWRWNIRDLLTFFLSTTDLLEGAVHILCQPLGVRPFLPFTLVWLFDLLICWTVLAKHCNPFNAVLHLRSTLVEIIFFLLFGHFFLFSCVNVRFCSNMSECSTHSTLVNCPTRWSLSFIFVFLCWSSIFPIPDTTEYSTAMC